MSAHGARKSAVQLVAWYRRRIDQSDIPEHVRPEVERQLRRLTRLERRGPEFRFTVAYLEWMLQLPWTLRRRAEDLFSRAEAVLTGP